MFRTPFLVAMSLAGLALAGCITPPGEDGSGDSGTFDAARAGSGDGTMSAREDQEDSVSPCVSGGAGFCAERVISITGSLANLPAMEVSLSTFNGRVDLSDAPSGEWSLTATLRARGSTPEAATAAMKDISFTWAHERNGAHLLEAKAEYKGRDDNANRGADLVATLPADVRLRVVADTINGGIEVEGVRTDGLSVQTTNGGIEVDAKVSSMNLQTVNGQIKAAITPTSAGRVTASTVNGGIEISVPEDDRHGYDLKGRTTNGKVDIELRDGELGPCPQGSQYYTPPCNERAFKTHRYESRETQTQMTLSTVNGGISVSPA